jgi:large repetitive protein
MVTLKASDLTIYEQGGVTVITAETEEPAEHELRVPLSFAGTMVNGADYQCGREIVILEGESVGVVCLTVTNATPYNQNETVIISSAESEDSIAITVAHDKRPKAGMSGMSGISGSL